MTGYSYAIEKENIFTSNGVELLLKIRDTINQLLDDAGAFQIDKVIQYQTGDTFLMLACVDYLDELGEIEMVGIGNVTQKQVYVRGM